MTWLHDYMIMSNYFILQECAWQAALSCLNQIILKHEHDPFIFLPKVCQHWPVGTHGYIVHSEPSPGRLTPSTGNNASLNTGGEIVFTTWFTGTLREVEFLMFYHLERIFGYVNMIMWCTITYKLPWNKFPKNHRYVLMKILFLVWYLVCQEQVVILDPSYQPCRIGQDLDSLEMKNHLSIHSGQEVEENSQRYCTCRMAWFLFPNKLKNL